MNASPQARLVYFAATTFRNQGRAFGIRADDRLFHMYIIGQTGTGKSTLLETLILQDILAGSGVALVDPHGDLAERIAAAIPDERREDLLYFNVPDPDQPFGYNPLKPVRADKIPLAASGLLEVMKKMWADAWGVRMEHILRNALLALLEQRDATLPDILHLLVDKRYRREVADSLRNPTVRAFWRTEYERYSPRLRAEAIVPIQNKVGAFLADPTLLRILTRPPRMLSLREVMDRGRILLVNLAKGRIGEDTSSLLGGLLVTTIGLAAFSRSDLPPGERRPFYLYIDEFQSFTTLSLANMASELRKYGVGLILAHQYLHQLEPEIRHAVIGNAGTIVAFRVGGQDAPFLVREFRPKFEIEDLLNLANYDIYLRLMIDGAPSKPFSARTLSPRKALALARLRG